MVKSYRVFTSAPVAYDSTRNSTTNAWVTVSSRTVSPPLPPATLDNAAHQISLLYQNVIFDGNDDDGQDESHEWNRVEEGCDPTIEWPPTNPADTSTRLNISRIDESHNEESFNTDYTGDGTTMQSEGSSISRFPSFNFSVNSLTPLTSLLRNSKPGAGSSKVTVLLGILEIDGPNYVTVKTGPHAGSEVGLLKLIIGDEHGAMCKLVAWRDTADTWGGNEAEPGLKRGDVVLFENVLFSCPFVRPQDRGDFAKAQLTASPNLKSTAQICCRTLPSTYDDTRWRPDLRLAGSVPAVRKVFEVVTWMERMAGIRTK